jgi:hypothetical protein
MGIEIRLQRDTLAMYTTGVNGPASTMRAHTESTSLRVRQGCAGSGMWAVSSSAKRCEETDSRGDRSQLVNDKE